VLEEAARQFGAQIKIRWHAYELRPDPVPMPDPDSEYIREHWENRVLPMAEARGLPMRVPRRQLRSRRALQAALFARAEGRFGPFDRALYAARFEEDADIADIDVLKRIAGGAGIDAGALAHAVSSGAHLDELEADLALAGALGVTGVPCAFVGPAIDESRRFYAEAEPVVGAVPYDWLAEAIGRARRGDRSQAQLRRRFRADIAIE
jgi:predicted DsbA family dithiol-disulfide isomerase